VFNQDDPNNPGPFTSTVSLRDDPEPALQRELGRAREERRVAGFVRVFGSIGLIVVFALLFDVYNDYVAHKREIPGLIARGQRIPAQLSGEPKNVGGRYSYTPDWYVEFSYSADGRAYTGSAYMNRRPASVTVVFDPLNPAAHRAVGSMEPSNVDGRRLIMLGAAAAALGFIVMLSWLTKLGE
jgi:hypothetical protein